LAWRSRTKVRLPTGEGNTTSGSQFRRQSRTLVGTKLGRRTFHRRLRQALKRIRLTSSPIER